MYTSTERSSGDQDVALREMATGEVRRVYVGGGRVFAGFWAPDGKALTATHWIEGNSDHVIYLVPADGGPAKRLTPSDVTATYWLGPWLPDGSGFLVRSNAGREFTGLAKLDAATGDLTWLVTPDWDVEYAALSADGRVLLWLVNVDGSSELHARNLLTGLDLEVPRLPMCDVAAASLSADGRVAAFLISTPTKPANLAVVDLDDSGGALRWITDNKPDVDTSSFVTPELVRYRSQDGTEIPALLYRPLGIDQPVGVVLWIHGGPTAQERPVYQRDGFHQYLLQRGIAVFAPNVRGSDGYGASYIQRLYRDWGGIDLDDWAAAVEYLQRQSWVDPERIGVYGGSYGGFGALSCLARLPEINWAAGVDRCGISNLVTLATASPPALKSLVALVIGDPVADAEFLLARSPVTYADQIRAPLFIIQGANDPRVPQAESDQMVARLRQRGVEVRYDVYPDEGHAFMKAENQVKADSDAAEFLIAHLAVYSSGALFSHPTSLTTCSSSTPTAHTSSRRTSFNTHSRRGSAYLGGSTTDVEGRPVALHRSMTWPRRHGTNPEW